MSHRKSIKDVLRVTITTYEAFGHDYTETQVVLRVDPALIVQMLAWDGVAHLPDRGFIHITDWKDQPKEVMRELKHTLFISYPSIVSGKKKPNAEGYYELSCVSSTATVQQGGICVPDHQEVLKNRSNVRVRRCI